MVPELMGRIAIFQLSIDVEHSVKRYAMLTMKIQWRLHHDTKSTAQEMNPQQYHQSTQQYTSITNRVALQCDISRHIKQIYSAK